MFKITIGVLILCCVAFLIGMFTLIKGFKTEDPDMKRKGTTVLAITLPALAVALVVLAICIIF